MNKAMKIHFLVVAVIILSVSPLNHLTAQNVFSERMGMIESTDHGVTWTFKGYANFHAPALNPVDPSAIFDNGLLVFYFFDLQSLVTDTAVVYRSVATDSTGLDFIPPESVFKFAGDITDPFVIKLPEDYRMYVNSPTAILSATSSNGFNFIQDSGDRTRTGGVPGAIVLHDSTVRLFVCGKGITSLISSNGLDFTEESGLRIPVPIGASLIADPSPIYCKDGKYRMAYKVRPAGAGENPQLDKVYLAESTDGLSWTTSSTPLAIGSVPTLVELPDGRLRIYYVNFQPDQPTGLFRHILKVQVMPDSISSGSSGIAYIPATNRIAVIVVTNLDHQTTMPSSEVCSNSVIGYVEYTSDMQPIGEYKSLTCNIADFHAMGIGNDVFFAKMGIPSGPGWLLQKFDGITWEKIASTEIELDDSVYMTGDPDVAYINGDFAITSTYNPGGNYIGGTHTQLFTTDLVPVNTILLYPPEVPEHRGEFSLLQLSNGDILMFASAGPSQGNLEVLRFDKDWHFLEQKWLLDSAYYSNGTATDGRYFFVAYLDWKQAHGQAGQNVRLAAFDTQWNLVDNVALTDVQSMGNFSYGEGTSIVLLGNRLYVSYNIVTLDSLTGLPENSIAYVDVFELNQTSVVQRPSTLEGFSLEQNYPNPFNLATTITFKLPSRQYTTLKLYDIQGREVATLVNEVKPQGTYTVHWDATGISSGVYFYQLQAGSLSESKKLLLLR
jgi:hypothetical protein